MTKIEKERYKNRVKFFKETICPWCSLLPMIYKPKREEMILIALNKYQKECPNCGRIYRSIEKYDDHKESHRIWISLQQLKAAHI